MINPPIRKASTAASSRSGAARGGEATRKFFESVFPCNPLISLDSDERIQGNPIAQNWGFRGELAGPKKIQTD